MSAVPTLTTHRDKVSSIPGSPPDLIDMPSGCKFHPRCPLAVEKCVQEEPRLAPTTGPEHLAACWRWPESKQTLMPSSKEERI
jgi:peptide/nickel transport system ATP-binding protein